jgi:hypothetical protein
MEKACLGYWKSMRGLRAINLIRRKHHVSLAKIRVWREEGKFHKCQAYKLHKDTTNIWVSQPLLASLELMLSRV